MSTHLAIDEVQMKLKEIIAKLGPDDVVVITDSNQPVARLLPAGKPQPQFGGCQGMLHVVAEDGEHLKDFQDYMP